MTFKTAAKSFGNGLLIAGTVLHNSPLETRMSEIDEEIENLQEQIAELQEERSDLDGRKI